MLFKKMFFFFFKKKIELNKTLKGFSNHLHKCIVEDIIKTKMNVFIDNCFFVWRIISWFIMKEIIVVDKIQFIYYILIIIKLRNIIVVFWNILSN